MREHAPGCHNAAADPVLVPVAECGYCRAWAAGHGTGVQAGWVGGLRSAAKFALATGDVPAAEHARVLRHVAANADNEMAGERARREAAGDE